MPAIIHFADGRTVNVNESVDQIQDAIKSLAPGIPPTIRLTEFGPANQPTLVSAASILIVNDLG